MFILRKWLPHLFLAWAVGSFALFLLFTFIGEKNWFSGLLLFLPPLPILLLSLLLLPFCIKQSWRLGAGCLCLIIFILLFIMGWHWTIQGKKKGNLSILTNNVGQRRLNRLWLFVKQHSPDMIVLQDSGNRERVFSRENPGYFVANHGEFTLLSRYEIKKSGFVSGIQNGNDPVAAWFEVGYSNQTIVVYNIHMPTPRGDLDKLRSSGVFSFKAISGYKAAQQAKLRLTLEVLDLLKKEQRPFIAAGDFNMASNGWLCRQYTSEFDEAFSTAGSGFGYTFPGGTMNPFSLFRPWLKLDHIFCRKDWKPVSCDVESDRFAQHQAVFAEFEVENALK